jgi:hypothetical protein
MTGYRLRQSALLSLVFGFLAVASAKAQIKSPGAHLRYDAEVDAHLVVQWAHQPRWHDDGLGLGVHVAIPVIESGPVTTINNSLAVAFGLDWAHFGDSCELRGVQDDDDCSANDFWLPVVAQWNFYFSKTISAFPELGLAIQHSRWESGYCQQPNGDYVYCDDRDGHSDTDVELVLWLGVRFHLADTFALTVRIGTPSLLLGASFYL